MLHLHFLANIVNTPFTIHYFNHRVLRNVKRFLVFVIMRDNICPVTTSMHIT